MKNNLSLLFFFLWSTYLIAQIQIGVVREQNSNKRPLGTVQVVFDGAVPTTSGDDGIFRLVFQGKKAGELIFFNEIKKNGYELVNGKDLEILKISSTNRLVEDIILAKSGVLETAKKEYYGISDRALLAGFEREKKALREKLQKSQVNQQQYADQLTALQEQYDLQKQNLDALAEQFARVNFDDVDSLYRKAFELFKTGEIEACKKKLENANLIGRTNLRLQERTRIVGAEKAIAKQKADNEKGIQDDIKALRLQTQTYLLTFEFSKAELLYDQLLQLDSTNLGILIETADFYREQHRYAKALRSYPKIIAHPEAQKWQIANAYSHLGELHTDTGNLTDAMFANEKFLKMYEELLSKQDTFSNSYKQNLANAYLQLGLTYNTLGKLNEALKCFENGLKLDKKIYKAYPSNIDNKNNMAVSNIRLGSTHTELGNLDIALKYFEDALELTTQIHKAHPNNVVYKRNLAYANSKLGLNYTARGNLEQGLLFHQTELKLTKEIFEIRPNDAIIIDQLAVAYDNLGSIYTKIGNLDQALLYFEEELNLSKQNHEAYPSNMLYKYGLNFIYNQLGTTHLTLGNLEKALAFFEVTLTLAEELYRTDSLNLVFKYSLGTANEMLGEVHRALGNLDKALGFSETLTSISKEIYESSPDDINSKLTLSIAYEHLGDVHTLLGNIDQALLFFESDFQLAKELYDALPNNIGLKYGLSVAYEKLGLTYSRLGNLDKALNYLQARFKLSKELNEASPDNVDFKSALAATFSQLGMFYQQHYPGNSLALTNLEWSENEYKELTKNYPDFVDFQNTLKEIQKVIFEIKHDPIFLIKTRIHNTPDTLTQYQLYKTLCDSIRIRLVLKPEYKSNLADALNSRAWLGFFFKKFAEVEADIREAIALQTDNKYLMTNLAPALLLQGKQKAAIAEYQKWKDKPFEEVGLTTYKAAFLDDLNAFEKAGIIPKNRLGDVAEIRKLLTKK